MYRFCGEETGTPCDTSNRQCTLANGYCPDPESKKKYTLRKIMMDGNRLKQLTNAFCAVDYGAVSEQNELEQLKVKL